MTTQTLLSVTSAIPSFVPKPRGRKSAFATHIETIKFMRYGPQASFAAINRHFIASRIVKRSYGAMLAFKNKNNIK